jgi:hypothetical protein
VLAVHLAPVGEAVGVEGEQGGDVGAAVAEDQERESAELIWRQHDGLGVLDVPGDLFRGTAGRITVLGCSCGIPKCWALTAHVEETARTVTWSAFRQAEREQWGELPIGPFVFARAAYEAALRSPTLLTADPLGPAPAGLGV